MPLFIVPRAVFSGPVCQFCLSQWPFFLLSRFRFVVPCFFLSYRGCSLQSSSKLLLFQCCTDSCADVSPVSPQLLLMFFLSFTLPFTPLLSLLLLPPLPRARPVDPCRGGTRGSGLHCTPGKRVGSMVGGLLLAAPSAPLLQELLLMLVLSLPHCSFPVLQLLLDVPS